MTTLLANAPAPDTNDYQHVTRPEDVLSLASSSSSTSAWSFIPRIGALAAVVEHAISRWARRTSSASSTTDSSTSSYPDRSSSSHTRAFGRRRRARSASAASAASEREVAARIRARRMFRHVPREFTFYLPPELVVDDQHGLVHAPREAVIHASSLDHILGAIKKASRLRRAEGAVSHMDSSIPSLYTDRRSVPTPRKRNGKQREDDMSRPLSGLYSSPIHKGRTTRAWWLNIANPTWDDMRTIGKLLHLHPLTLEDILQQDTREKLELFPRLGYQFIVFRASESAGVPSQNQEPSEIDSNDHECDEGLIREVNVYLVIFREGICTFHFNDISEHIERVRSRLQVLQSNHLSSDWIAHSILDSVVDSFFPILTKVEKEVAAIEAIIYAGAEPEESNQVACLSTANLQDLTASEKRKPSFNSFSEKTDAAVEPTRRTAVPYLGFLQYSRRQIRRAAVFFRNMWAPRTGIASSQVASMTTLMRMTRTRRLVTSLTRLLASKSEVVSQARKRYLGSEKLATNDNLEIVMYMGDVQDHILTLQQLLTHYEDILSESHSAYLSLLRMNVSDVRGWSDRALLKLTLVSLGALAPGPVIGAFSMNIHTPRNTTHNPIPSGGHYWFGIVLALVFLIECSFLVVVRYWWAQSKKRRISNLS